MSAQVEMRLYEPVLEMTKLLHGCSHHGNKTKHAKRQAHAVLRHSNRANAVKAKEHMNASFNKIDSESAYREFMRMERILSVQKNSPFPFWQELIR